MEFRERLDPELLKELAFYRMPYGKHKGEYLSELPDYYLTWWRQKGWPDGRLGLMMASQYEISINGLQDVLRRIRQIEGPQR